MKYYKGFNPDFTCKGKQYEENHDYEENGTHICGEGMMHFCENPFDVWNYYPIVNANGELNEYAEVEPLADVVTREDKCASTKIHIGAKIGLSGIIKAAVEFVIEKTKVEKEENVIGSSGDSAQIGSSGDSAKIGSSGDYAQIGSSGHSAQIGSSGDSAKISSTGEDSVICCAGHGSVVRAKKGSWITLAEWEHSDAKGRWIPKTVQTFFVDGETVKADTFYTLKDGELKEVIE